MPGFRRVYTQFPGFDILGNIESVNIIDIPPPVTPLGAGTGVICLVGEFEKGAFNAPTRIFGGTDLTDKFGGFGFQKDGALYQGPVAQRSAGASQPWEGNAFIQLRNKRFAGLVVCRVDNSAGDVEFRRLASVTGGAAPFNLEPGQTITIDVDGGGAVAATFDAARAVKAGDGFPGDASQCWQFDDSGGSYVDMTTEFNDATSANLILFPATEAVDDAFYIGRSSGTFEQVIFDNAGGTAGVDGGSLAVTWEYWNGSAWTALTGVTDGTSNFTAGPSDGQTVSWTVPVDWAANAVNSSTAYWVRARISAGSYSTNPVYDQGYVDANNVTNFLGGETLQLSWDGGGTQTITFTSSEQTLAQVVSYINSVTASDIAVANGTQLDLRSVQRGTGGSITVVGGTAAGSLGQAVGTANGTGDVADIDAVTLAEVTTVVEADIANTQVDADADGNLRISATATPGTGTIEVTAVTATGLGIAVSAAAVSAATAAEAQTIPAGTRVRDVTNTVDWVTVDDLTIPTDSGGPWTIGVRPFLDTDTAPTAAAGDVTTIVDTLTDSFAVTNTADLNRLNAAQMDAAYLDAFNATLDSNGVSFDINATFCARSTANTMRYGYENAVDATRTGHRARKFVTAPPVGTSITDATATTGVGVGANRHQRKFYCFPGMTTLIPEIARVGATAGGVGFTDDGVIEVRSDGFYASVRSLMPPEENCGQDLRETNAGAMSALSLEDLYNPEEGGTGLTIDNYINFKANGIIAPRQERVSGLIFQSDVTSVNPSVDAALADSKRRWMGDFIMDSLGDIALPFVKKLNTTTRRRALQGQINAFLKLLKSEDQPELSRIHSYSVTDDTTSTQRDLGFQLFTVRVKLHPSMDSIVITTEVGTTVVVEEV